MQPSLDFVRRYLDESDLYDEIYLMLFVHDVKFVRWCQSQSYNPDWLGDVTMEDYKKAGVWRLIRSFIFQITDRIEDKAPLIQAPVLVIRGEHDPISHQAFCETLVRLCPRGRLLIVPDVAHTLVFTAPVQLAEATRAFLHG